MPILGGPANPIVPKWVLNKMRAHIMKSYVCGRQEDAHEFLRFFIEALEASRLCEYKGHKLDSFTKETNMISRIFGGFTRNTIACSACSEKSATYDPFLDLSLEIGTRPVSFYGTGAVVNSVEEALKHFTKSEQLYGSNAYKCFNCKCRVNALKRLQIHRAPHILTVHLKRFDQVGKISKHISYKERLDLTPYMSQETSSERVIYQLYGVIVHTGNTTNSGHYYAYVKSMLGQWFIADDSRMQPVGDHQAKTAQAYMLFYQRWSTPKAEVRPQAHIASSTASTASTAHATASESLPIHMPIVKIGPKLAPGLATNRITHLVQPLSPRKPLSTVERLKVQAKTLGISVKKEDEPTRLVPYDDDDEDESNSSSPIGTKSSSKSSTPINVFESMKMDDKDVRKRPPIKIRINLRMDKTREQPADSDQVQEEDKKRKRKHGRREKRREKRRRSEQVWRSSEEETRKKMRVDSERFHGQVPYNGARNRHNNGEDPCLGALQAIGGRGYGSLVQPWSSDKPSNVNRPLMEQSPVESDSYDEEGEEHRRWRKKRKMDKRRTGTDEDCRVQDNSFQRVYDAGGHKVSGDRECKHIQCNPYNAMRYAV